MESVENYNGMPVKQSIRKQKAAYTFNLRGKKSKYLEVTRNGQPVPKLNRKGYRKCADALANMFYETFCQMEEAGYCEITMELLATKVFNNQNPNEQ